MSKLRWLCLLIVVILGFSHISAAVEAGMYRLLSISNSEKLILISQIPNKTKYLLDASSAKITMNGKPAEFKDLKSFSVIQLKPTLKKSNKNGIRIDGSTNEIKILVPEELPK